MPRGLSLVCLLVAVGHTPELFAQDPSAADADMIQQRLDELSKSLVELKKEQRDTRSVADIELFAKAADWAIRHHEFFKPEYSQWTKDALETGRQRSRELAQGTTPWFPREGSTVLGYYSRVDDSVQPYVVTFPKGYDANVNRQWPLHVELHGRGDELNEIQFIHQHDGKPQKSDATWVQLDVFGRTNNAYRWAGETDVFEAMAALRRRVRIDDNRITLRGFSMGGAGAWHLGLHHPSLWSSIGAGAGFIDTENYLKTKTPHSPPLTPLSQKLTKIYDAQEYALNAFDVPTIGYAGELDAQLVAAKTMHAKGEELAVPIRLLIGPQTAHKWEPGSLKEFMAFHAEHTQQGRPLYPGPAQLKFMTYTLKYNRCEWMTIEEQIVPYEQTIVEADVDVPNRTVNIKTKNVSLIQIMRDVADFAIIDENGPLPLSTAAGNLLPGVYYEKQSEGWVAMDANQSHKYAARETGNDELHKRHDLQGPIDDAFMQPFVCVRPTGTAWTSEQNEWAKWTLDRFEKEFDHRLRGRVPVVKDTQVTEELMETRHLILFGDPGSNSMLAKIVDKLPLKWTRERMELNGQSYRSAEHGVALIYPNPLNPRKYVVVNSGHTFHEPEFKGSNANLYPRLGDVAVIKFVAQLSGEYTENILFADVFNSRWQLEVKTP